MRSTALHLVPKSKLRLPSIPFHPGLCQRSLSRALDWRQPYSQLPCKHRTTRQAGYQPQAHRRLLSSTAALEDDALPAIFPLVSRSLVAVTGSDAAKFLQGLTTNNIPFDVPPDIGASNHIPRAIASAFLNARGRLLQDALIYPLPPTSMLWQTIGIQVDSDCPGFLIEVDHNQLDSFYKTLRRYRLRSKVTITRMESERIGAAAVWEPGLHEETLPSVIEHLRSQGAHCVRDERAPGFGFRAIVPAGLLSASLPARMVSEAEYRQRRYLLSVPEGQAELPWEAANVHESDMDYMLGVDFRKGCYVGQEFVIRTQHTGVIRKRILPVMLYQAGEPPPSTLAASDSSASALQSIPYGADIKNATEDGSSRKVQSVGKWVANQGNIGLALARLEPMVGLGPTGEKVNGWQAPEFVVDHDFGSGEQLRVKAFVPDWWKERRVSKAL